jgi:Fe-S cluster biogenesis protein NfuA
MTTEELTTEVQKALEEIRPFLNSDGGDITLVSIEDGKHVKVRLE